MLDDDVVTCKAAVFTAVNQIEYGNIPIPTVIFECDAILKVIVCGLCGSDLHPYHGKEAVLPNISNLNDFSLTTYTVVCLWNRIWP